MTSEPIKCTIDDLADPLPSIFTNAKIIGENISYAEYSKQTVVARGQPGYVMSRTDLCEFDRCPVRWRNGYKDGGSESTEWGQLMDALVLGRFSEQVAVCPETYPAPAHHERVKKGKIKEGDPLPWRFGAEYCDDWFALQEGKLVVKAKKADEAREAMNILEEDEAVFAVLDDSRKQVFVGGEYHDSETGIVVPVRCLIDLVPEHANEMLADFKTCNSAHPRAWAKSAFDYDYHTQAALYLDLFNAATGEQRDEFRHVLQESFKPYQVAKRIMSAEFISLGREKYRRILKRYAECLKTGQWDDYDSGGPHDVVIDGWLVTQPLDWMILQ